MGFCGVGVVCDMIRVFEVEWEDLKISFFGLALIQV